MGYHDPFILGPLLSAAWPSRALEIIAFKCGLLEVLLLSLGEDVQVRENVEI